MPSGTRRDLIHVLILAPALYLTWMGMMAVHELGHMLHAWISGGRVARVSLPLVGFSQTFFSRNPRAYFVVWGGPVWGSILPVLLWSMVPWRWRTLRRMAQFFAGFCLIANGAYLGVGWALNVGDAGDLRRAGTWPGLMIAFGAIAMALGLYFWHLLGLKRTPDVAAANPS